MSGMPDLAGYQGALELAAAGLALVILLSSLDDLFIDFWYWVRRAHRWLVLHHGGRLQPLTPAQLRERAEQRIAIMVPAWQESDVIAAMVENMVQVLEYQQYQVFIGTYVNDPATIAEVERMARRYRQVCRVEVPHPGPTCKADCLNFMVEAIFAHERAAGVEFAGVVLHDSEDVLHPLELKFFNFLLPRKDMIQLPVASLERGLTEWVAGTYMDEFAESHGKEMLVRESLSGTVPSAGVGTCFSRRALTALVGTTRNHPFNTESLTEDYDVGMRLQALGMQSIFGIFPVSYRVRRKDFGGAAREQEVHAPLAVREFFPDSFRAAYRQKSRWALGIGLQGWHQIPWRGRSLAARYLLLHDRKGMVTSFIGIAAYALVLQFAVLQAGAAAGWWAPVAPQLFVASSPWAALVWVNAGLLAVRISHRMYFTTRLYGWRHGLLSVPRMVVGNFVNCMAVGRAWRLYLASMLLGRRLVWDKTAHEFPATDPSTRQHRPLGELLQTWQAIEPGQLAQALQQQTERAAPLGQVLLANGWLDEETLAEAIAYQADLPRAELPPQAAGDECGGLGLAAALSHRHRAIWLGPNASGQPVLAVGAPLHAQALAEIEAHLGAPPLLRIARDSEIEAALRRLMALVAVEPGATAEAAQPIRVVPAEHAAVGEFLAEQGARLREAIGHAVHPTPGGAQGAAAT